MVDLSESRAGWCRYGRLHSVTSLSIYQTYEKHILCFAQTFIPRFFLHQSPTYDEAITPSSTVGCPPCSNQDRLPDELVSLILSYIRVEPEDLANIPYPHPNGENVPLAGKLRTTCSS